MGVSVNWRAAPPQFDLSYLASVEMSLFGKIKTAVRGNPVTRDYEIDKHVASAGPGLLWKVHNGVKKTSRQAVSVFVFNKKAPEFDRLTKKQREALCEMLKKVRYAMIPLFR